MKKEHRSEVEIDETAWTVTATAQDDCLMAEVVGASTRDGTVEVRLSLAGEQRHLATVEDIAAELQSVLCGASRRRRRPGAYRLATIRRELPRAYAPWTEADEALLLERWDAGGDTVESLATELGRGPGGVRARLMRLGRLQEAG